jgi:hypothetical protein
MSDLKEILEEESPKVLGISIPLLLKTNILGILASRNPDKFNAVSEMIVDFIKANTNIYTVRSDVDTTVYIYKEGVYVPEGKTYIKEFVRSILGDAYSSYIVNQVIAKIEADTFIDPVAFYDCSPVDEIAVKNGILNVLTKELTDFTPSKIFFKRFQ